MQISSLGHSHVAHRVLDLERPTTRFIGAEEAFLPDNTGGREPNGLEITYTGLGRLE